MPWSASDSHDSLSCCACPLDTSPIGDAWLCSYTRRIVGGDIVAIQNTALKKLLGWERPLDVVKIAVQLRELSKVFAGLYNVGNTDDTSPSAIELQSFRERMTALIPQLYSRLNSAHETKYSDIYEVLSNSAFIWVGSMFVELSKIALRVTVDVTPYLFQLPPDLQVYTKLLTIFKIKPDFSTENYLDVLKQMAIETKAVVMDTMLKKFVNNANSNQIIPLSAKLIGLALSLVPLLNPNNSYSNTTVTNIYIPDSHNRLGLSTDLINDDVPWLTGNEHLSIRVGCRLVHPNISSKVAESLGVKSLRLVLLNKNIDSNLFSGSPTADGSVTMESFGQAESLTNRLKTILDMYPDGNPIFSELIQNADDAGASTICIVLDEQTYPSESLLDPRLAALQGPSLVVRNDALFTENDFKALARIGQGSKLQQLATTGRFGLGFNSTYHVTDTPTVISGDFMVIFDPHCSHVPGATLNQPGLRIKFNNGNGGNSLKSTFKNQFEPLEYFHCDFEKSYQGTLFRFPLRTESMALKSEISKRSYSVLDMEANIQQLITQLPNMLLFLRSVKTIEIYRNFKNESEISSQFRQPVLLHRATASQTILQIKNDQTLLKFFDKQSSINSLVAIQSKGIVAPGIKNTANVSNVSNGKDVFYDRLLTTPDSQLPEQYCKMHIVVEEFQISSEASFIIDSKSNSKIYPTISLVEIDYLLVSGLCGGEAKRIACDSSMRHFKLVPMGSVAACISRKCKTKGSITVDSSSSTKNELIGDAPLPTASSSKNLELFPQTPGMAFCFLPLTSVVTQIPVHVNAYWELSSNRRDIWRGDDTKGEAKLRSDWNIQVMKDVIAPLYARLLVSVCSMIQQQFKDHDSRISYHYKLLSLMPCPVPQKPWDIVALSLFPLLQQQSLLYCNLLGGSYVPFKNSYLLEREPDEKDEQKDRVQSLLLSEKLQIVPVTSGVLTALTDSHCVSGEVSPALIRYYFNITHSMHGKHLTITVSSKLTPREVIENVAFLLQYCISDFNKSSGQLVGVLRGVKLLPMEDYSIGTFGDPMDGEEYFTVTDLERKLLSKAGSKIVASAEITGNLFSNYLKDPHFLSQYNIKPINVINVLKLIRSFVPKFWLEPTTIVALQDVAIISDEWLVSLWNYILDQDAVDVYKEVLPMLPILTPAHLIPATNVVTSSANTSILPPSYLVKISPSIPVLHMQFKDMPPNAVSALSEAGVYIFDQSLLGALSYSNGVSKLLSIPSPRGFLNALLTVKSKLDNSSQKWTYAMRADLREYILDHVIDKTSNLTPDDIALICSLPIWVTHSIESCDRELDSATVELVTLKNVVIPPIGIDVRLLNNSYIRTRNHRDRSIYAMLGIPDSKKASFYSNYIIPKIASRELPDHLIDTVVCDLLKDLNNLESQSPGFINLMSNSAVIRSNSRTLCMAKELYDPEATLIQSLLPSDLFPNSSVFSDSALLLSLRLLGLNTVVNAEGVIRAALGVQSDAEVALTLGNSSEAKEKLDGAIYRGSRLLLYLQNNAERLLTEVDLDGLKRALSNQIPMEYESNVEDNSTSLQILGGAWSQRLRNISWIPVATLLVPKLRDAGLPWVTQFHTSPLATPSTSTSLSNIWYCSSVRRICNVDVKNDLVLTLLGWNRALSGRSLAIQLLKIREEYEKRENSKSSTEYETIIPIIISKLNEIFEREGNMEHQGWIPLLVNKPIFWIQNRFLEASRVAFKGLSLSTEPFLFVVPSEMNKYKKFFLTLGARESFVALDLANLTRDLYATHIEATSNVSSSTSQSAIKPLNADKLKLIIGVLQILYSLMVGDDIATPMVDTTTGVVGGGVDDDGSPLSPISIPLVTLQSLGVLYLPDTNMQLYPATSLTFDDAPWVSSALNQPNQQQNIKFVHSHLDIKIAIKLGCLSLREQLFSGDDIPCPDPERLNGLLDDDTAKDALNDLISLGDSLNAKHVHVVYDSNSNPVESLMHPGLADAQGHSLLVFLEGVVLDKEHLTKLLTLPNFSDHDELHHYHSSEPSSPNASVDPTTHLYRSKYRPSRGKRLISAFTVTDCLQIVTGSDYYVFDPTGQFLMPNGSDEPDVPKVKGKLSKKNSQSNVKQASAKAQHYSFSNKDKAGKLVTNLQNNVLNRFPDQFSSFLRMPCNMKDQFSQFRVQGLLIRLPLRTKKSSISRLLTTVSDIKQLYGGYKNNLSGALIFATKQLLSITLYHIDCNFIEEAVSRDNSKADREQVAMVNESVLKVDIIAKLLSEPDKRRQRHSVLEDKGWKTRGINKLFQKTYSPNEITFTLKLDIFINDRTWFIPSVQLSHHLSQLSEERRLEQASFIEEWLVCAGNGYSKLRDLAVNEPYNNLKILPCVAIAIQILPEMLLNAVSVPPEYGMQFYGACSVGATGLPFHIEGQYLLPNNYSIEKEMAFTPEVSQQVTQRRSIFHKAPSSNSSAISTAHGSFQGIVGPEEIGIIQSWNESLIRVAIENLYPKMLQELKVIVDNTILGGAVAVPRTVASNQAQMENARGFYKYFIYKQRVTSMIQKIIKKTSITSQIVYSPYFLTNTGFKKLDEIMLPVKVFPCVVSSFLEYSLPLAVCPVQLHIDLKEEGIKIASLTAARFRVALKSNVLMYTSKLNNIIAANGHPLILSLLNFALSDLAAAASDGEFVLKKLYRELSGCPLLPLANGTVKAFPVAKDAQVAKAPLIFHSLLPMLCSTFVHPIITQDISFFKDELFKDSLFISSFGSGFIMDKISAILPAKWRSVQAIQWVAAGGSHVVSSMPRLSAGDVKPPTELLVFALWKEVLINENMNMLAKFGDTVLVPVISRSRRILLSTSLLCHVFASDPTEAQDNNRSHIKREFGRMESLALSAYSGISSVDNSLNAVDPWKWTSESYDVYTSFQNHDIKTSDNTTNGIVEGDAVFQVLPDDEEEVSSARSSTNSERVVAMPNTQEPPLLQTPGVHTLAPQTDLSRAGGLNSLSPDLLLAMVRLGVPFLDGNILEGIPVPLRMPNTDTGRKLLNCLHALFVQQINVFIPVASSNSSENSSENLSTTHDQLTNAGQLLSFIDLNSVDRSTLLLCLYSSHRISPLSPEEITKWKQIPLFTNQTDGSAIALSDCKGGVYWCVDNSVLDGITFSSSNISKSANSSSSSSSSLVAEGPVIAAVPPIILINDPLLKEVYSFLNVEELTPATAVKKFIIPALPTMDNRTRLEVMKSLALKWNLYSSDTALVAVLKGVSFIPSWIVNHESETQPTMHSIRSTRRCNELFVWSNVALLDTLSGDSVSSYFSPPYMRSAELLTMCSDLGMNKDITEELFMKLVLEIQESAMTAADIQDETYLHLAAERGRRLLRYVLSEDRSTVLFQNTSFTKKIGKVKFVPMKRPESVTEGGFVSYKEDVGCFEQFLSKTKGELAFTVMPILEDDITPAQYYFSNLGISANPPSEVVLRHIRNMTTKGDSLDRWNCIRYTIAETFGAIFTFLEEKWSSIPVAIQESLKTTNVIPIGHSLIKPSRLFFRLSEDLSPFMHEIPRHFGIHEKFLKLLGIKEAPTASDYVQFLFDLSKESGQNSLNPNELRAVVAILTSIATQQDEGISTTRSYLSDLFVPDEDSVMRNICFCLINDNSWLRNKVSNGLLSLHYHCVHSSISSTTATMLGIVGLSTVLVEKLSAFARSSDYVAEHQELSEVYYSAINDATFVASLSSLLANSPQRDEISYTAKLKAVQFHFLRNLNTKLRFTMSERELIDVSSNSGNSAETVSFLDKVNSVNHVFVNYNLISPPITVEIAISTAICQLVGLDMSLATSLACLLSVAKSSKDSAQSQFILNSLRIGSDVSTIREQFRGVPGELVTSQDMRLIELKPFRIFRLGEIVAFDGACMNSTATNTSFVDTSISLRYAKVVTIGDSSESGMRRLTLKIGSDTATMLSTEVYSFRSAREESVSKDSSIAGNSKILPSNKHFLNSSSLAEGNRSRNAHMDASNEASSTPATDNFVNANIGKEELMTVVNGLLMRAGVPANLEQQALMSRIVDLESTVKQAATELEIERSQLVQSNQALAKATGAFKCQICVEEVISHVLIPCGHTYCGTCVDHLPNGKCAMCRRPFNNKMKFFVADT